MLATLPAFALRPHTENIILPATPGRRPEWDDAAIFAKDNADNYLNVIWLARLAGVVWSIFGGWIVYRWSQNLYGGPAGLLALVLWCFGPTILAHAPLVTPDVPAAVMAVAATYAFWCYLSDGSWGSAVNAGVLLGVAQLTKFTLLILYCIWPFLFWLRIFFDATFGLNSLRRRLCQGVAIFTLSLLIINLGYEFEGSFQRLGNFQFVSHLLKGRSMDVQNEDDFQAGNRFRQTWLDRLPIPIPTAYLTGIDLQRRDFEGDMPPSYLGGEWRDHGWWYYYLYALGVKVPLGTWVLVLWGFGLTLFGSDRKGLLDELTLLLPVIAVLVLVSSQTGFNHHFRYVLPAIPFVCISTGKLGRLLTWRHWKAGTVVGALLLASVASSLRVYPHSLSYFNDLAGGPDHGAEHLVDSNIDWGQDLFFFFNWADKHPDARPLALAYFNYIDYRVVTGRSYADVPPDPGAPSIPLGEAERVGPHPGWFGVDVYSLKAGQYKYFNRFTPVAKAGYSIFIYHITLSEANAVRRQMGLAPLPELELP